jgi:lipopolysaccharide/colanic/teichoic acid biosynthesis glycosyltransferase
MREVFQMTYMSERTRDPGGARALALARFDDSSARTQPWEAYVPARIPETGFYRARGKRAFDLVASAAMLVAFAPLLAVLMLIVGFDGGRPIFAHTRVGRLGRQFRCLKIRSMRHGAEQELAAILAADPAAAAEWAREAKLTDDPRTTRIGAFLRKASLDELPQLWNVLRGEMSLVGPRPVTADELQRYGAAAASYMALKPGLTGPWQVDGRNAISYDDRVALDVDYARSHGFRRDVSIVIRTALSVLKLTGK